MDEKRNTFVGYEYTTVDAAYELESAVIDGYKNFGWELDSRESSLGFGNNLKFKRDRKIRNKAELSRLQRKFDNNIKEIERLEASKTSSAQITALVIGFVGTAFLGGATFSYLAGLIPLTIILAIPGFICWIVPYFAYNSIVSKNSAKISVLAEEKYDEIYSICQQANELLTV